MLQREQIHFGRNPLLDLRPRLTKEERKAMPVSDDDISCPLLDVWDVGVEHFGNSGHDLLTYGIRPNNSAFNDYAFVGVPNHVGSTLNFFNAGVLLIGRIELFAQPPDLFSIILPPIERLPSPFV